MMEGKKGRARRCWQLLHTFVRIGAFTFGGGYAMIPLIQREAVEKRGWIEDRDVLDILAVAESTPGPIAVNSATFVGIRIAGIPGALVATFGCILPSCILVTAIARLYLKYRNMSVLQGVLGSLRPAVVAMIASAGISILQTAFWGGAAVTFSGISWLMVALFVVAFLLLQTHRIGPIQVMLLAGLARVGASLLLGI